MWLFFVMALLTVRVGEPPPGSFSPNIRIVEECVWRGEFVPCAALDSLREDSRRQPSTGKS